MNKWFLRLVATNFPYPPPRPRIRSGGYGYLGVAQVRSTKPVIFVPAEFVCSTEYATQRTTAHRAKHPGYPDPNFYLGLTGKYFLRRASCCVWRRTLAMCSPFALAGGGRA